MPHAASGNGHGGAVTTSPILILEVTNDSDRRQRQQNTNQRRPEELSGIDKPYGNRGGQCTPYYAAEIKENL